MSVSNQAGISPPRRTFLKASTLASAGLFIQYSKETHAANDRIRFGVIGCGGRGYDHIRDLVRRRDEGEGVEITAVCDIYERRKERAHDATGAKVYHDYNELLDDSSIDAVVIASPDHWHAKMSIDAMRKGKDIYLEKPMTLYAHEAKEVYEESVKTGRLIQVGNQGASAPSVWQARELIESGAIGQVIWAQGSAARNSREGEWNWGIDPNASPENVDWKAFLGPAPERPWDPERFFRYRKFWDYSGGIATDLFYHTLGFLSVPLDSGFPTRVIGMGGVWAQDDGREVPDTFMMTADYPEKYTVNLVSSMANEQGVQTVVRGQKGTIYFPTQAMRNAGDWNLVVRGESAFMDEFVERFEDREIRFPIEDSHPYAHTDNLIECMRTREQPRMNALQGYKTSVAICMSVESYRKQKMLFFDPEREAVVESPMA